MATCPCDVRPFPPAPDIAAGLDRLPRQIAGFPEFRLALLAGISGQPALDAWRAREGRRAIDSSGRLPDGTAYKNVAQFRALLNTRQAEFRKALVEKLLIYALGRGLEYADARAVREICASVERQGDRFSGVMLAIVESDLFQKRQATGDSNHQPTGE